MANGREWGKFKRQLMRLCLGGKLHLFLKKWENVCYVLILNKNNIYTQSMKIKWTVVCTVKAYKELGMLLSYSR